MPGKNDDNKDKGTTRVAPVDAPNSPAPEKKDTPDDKVQKPEEKLLFGKYKSNEEAEKGFKELEKKHGDQGRELGTLRQKVAQYESEKAEQAKKTSEQKPPGTDYEAKLSEIYDKLESGDISVTEALKQSNTLTAAIARQQTLDEAGKHTRDLLLDKDAEVAEKQWHKDYPDYQEFVESGQAQEYMKKNPILIDETIAYFQFKADQRFEEGKAEAERIAKGADPADTVVKEPGAPVQRKPVRQKPLSDDELVTEQMNTLKKIRGEA